MAEALKRAVDVDALLAAWTLLTLVHICEGHFDKSNNFDVALKKKPGKLSLGYLVQLEMIQRGLTASRFKREPECVQQGRAPVI